MLKGLQDRFKFTETQDDNRNSQKENNNNKEFFHFNDYTQNKRDRFLCLSRLFHHCRQRSTSATTAHNGRVIQQLHDRSHQSSDISQSSGVQYGINAAPLFFRLNDSGLLKQLLRPGRCVKFHGQSGQSKHGTACKNQHAQSRKFGPADEQANHN